MKFSLDMVNVHLIIKRSMFLGLGENIDGQEFVQKILFNERSNDFTYYETKKHSCYRYNITHKTEEGTVYYGLMHNSKNVKDEIDIKIEYNPNKFEEVPYRVRVLLSLSKVAKIKSIDFAIDIDIDKSNLIFDENRKNTNIYKGTYYIGARNNGIKIYDKAKEQGLTDIDWTRIEYRIPIDYIFKNYANTEFDLMQCLNEFIFPDISFYGQDCNEDLDAEIILILEGLKVRPEMYKKLTRRKKEKIDKALKQLTQLEFKDLTKEIEKLTKNYINDIIN